MVTLENELHQESATTLRNESFGEVGLSFVTVCGGMAGALGGSALGVEAATAFPLVFGVLGTLFGGTLTAGAWCLFERVRASISKRAAAGRVQPQPSGARAAAHVG